MTKKLVALFLYLSVAKLKKQRTLSILVSSKNESFSPSILTLTISVVPADVAGSRLAIKNARIFLFDLISLFPSHLERAQVAAPLKKISPGLPSTDSYLIPERIVSSFFHFFFFVKTFFLENARNRSHSSWPVR